MSATIQQYANHDFNKVGQLLNVRLHNINAFDMAMLEGTLGPDNTGLTVYNTDQLCQYTFDGTRFVKDVVEVAGQMIFRGSIAAAQYDDLPANRESGSQYVMADDGDLYFEDTHNATPGNESNQITITYNPSRTVAAGDMIIWTDETTVQVIERNAEQATHSTHGLIRLASTADMLLGMDDSKAVTPKAFRERVDQLKLTRYNVKKSLNLTANTPLTINHGLGLSDPEGFVNQVLVNGKEVACECTAIDTNSFSIETNVSLGNVTVTTIGW